MRKVIHVMPCLDIRDGRVVKGIHFADLIDAGDPVECATAYEAAGADELCFLDIAATVEKRRLVVDVLKRVTEAIKIPVMVGGGIASLKDVEAVLEAGAAKISISSAAFRNPEFVGKAVKRFGGERVVLGMDTDRNAALPSKREVYIDGGRTATGVDVMEFVRRVAGFGVGEIMPSSRLTDGAKQGYDLDLIRMIADETGVPVVASGGAGKLIHFVEAVKMGHASTLLAASVFHFGTFTIQQVKMYLHRRGIPVRDVPRPKF